MADAVLDRDEIIELTYRMAWHLDHLEWDEMVKLFSPEVLLDYTSLNGGEPVRVARDEMVASWRANRTGLEATQHLLSNHIVTSRADTAEATAMFQATHRLNNPHGGPLWTLGGKYRYGFVRGDDGWRIDALTLEIIWADGNRNIRDLALAVSQ